MLLPFSLLLPHHVVLLHPLLLMDLVLLVFLFLPPQPPQVGCLARVPSHTMAAKPFAWSMRSDLPFPLNCRLVFVLFGTGWLLPLSLTRCLSDVDVTRPKDGHSSGEEDHLLRQDRMGH